MPRGTLAGQLAAMGFGDTARARQLLTGDLGLDPEGPDAPLVEALAGAADPDLALAALARMAPDEELRAALRADQELRDRLVTVAGRTQPVLADPHERVIAAARRLLSSWAH